MQISFTSRIQLILISFTSPLLFNQMVTGLCALCEAVFFKAKLQELYNFWIMNEDRMEWTKNGNRRPALMDVYLGWICIAWNSLSNEVIAKSFKNCGITVCHDGSEEGRLMLQDARAWLDVERNQFEEADPKQDEENGYLNDDSFNFDDCVIDC